MLIHVPGYEEEGPAENYYANEYYDDGYSPSPPRPTGGAYYPESTNFPPPPVPPAGGYTQQTTTTTTQAPYPPHPPYDPAHHPPYNPAEYPPQPPVDPYGYPAPRDVREGGNVSSTTPFVSLAPTPQPRNMYNIADEEGAS